MCGNPIMVDVTGFPNAAIFEEGPLEESVLSALKNYIRAIESAHSALGPLEIEETISQAVLDEASGVISLVEATQLALFSALRSAGRPVPPPVQS
jgi:hypothetical protein